MAEYRLAEQKYTEAEYLFQTIEMAKSDEEYDLCGASPPRRTDLISDLDIVQESPSNILNWKVVKRRQRRRYTVSHSGGAPPAPPSTPTSLTAMATPTPSPTATNSMNTTVATTAATAINAAAEADERLKSLFYILDYAPKYKKKLKEQQRTDAELAALLNVITLSSSSSSNGGAGIGGGGGNGNSGSAGSSHQPLEHRICATSRTIRKPTSSTKIFKIHRNPKWFFREPDHEEDSVSAPEYDDTDDDERRYRRQIKRRSFLVALRQRRFARFEQQERMEAMMHDFGSAMTLNEV